MTDTVIRISGNEQQSDRFDRFRLISWWDQQRLAAAKVLVIGAGALGNEIVKNLALLGVGNVLMTASYDGGATWSDPIQVNDNVSPVDEFQPNLSVAADGTVSNAFYDRRLLCPEAGTPEGTGAGIGPTPFDPAASGASNYCVNASVQFYRPDLTAIGNNVRLTEHTWDPQLSSPHPGNPNGTETFIGDYFGNDASGPADVFTFVSTYGDPFNPGHHQQQVVATIATP